MVVEIDEVKVEDEVEVEVLDEDGGELTEEVPDSEMEDDKEDDESSREEAEHDGESPADKVDIVSNKFEVKCDVIRLHHC